jgi:hypothetical protein
MPMATLLSVISKKVRNMAMELTIGLLITRSMLGSGLVDCLMGRVFILQRISIRVTLLMV